MDIMGAEVSILWHSAQLLGGRYPAEWHLLHKMRSCFPSRLMGCHAILGPGIIAPRGESTPRSGMVWQIVHSVVRTFPLFATCLPSSGREAPRPARVPAGRGGRRPSHPPF